MKLLNKGEKNNMYSQRTRNIIIGSITAVIVVTALLTFGITLYATTDLFKSNDTLFYKYLSQTLESLKYVENSQLSEIADLKADQAYELAGNISYSENIVNKNPVNAQLEFQIAQNNQKKEGHGKLSLVHNNQSIFDVEYANSNDIIALKSPEIVNAYLGVRNENLQELAKKLGIENEEIIPNSIKEIKLDELFYITEEQNDFIRQTYLEILEQNIDKSKFTKEKDLMVSRDGENYKTTAYHLSLTDEELKQVEIAILQKLKEDDTTLNIIEEKMQMLGINNLEIDKLKNLIQIQIDKINARNIKSGSGINIMLYTTGGRIITTEIIYENSIKCTIYGTSNEKESKRYLLVENLNINTEFEKIEINENEIRSETESSYNAIININDKKQVKANLLNTGSAEEGEVTSTCKVEIEEKDKTQTISYEGKTEFDNNNAENFVQLNKTNCGILNDYEGKQLKVLIEAISEKIKEVVEQKLQMIGLTKN